MAAKDIMVNIVAKDREALLTASMLGSMQILKNDFGFTQEQLTSFAEKWIPAVKANLPSNMR